MTNGIPLDHPFKEVPVSWRVAHSLNVLLAEIDAAAPNRSKVSDGSIGDAAHASRDSDHNPWIIHGGQGIVRARDFTHDPAGGLDCNLLAERLAELIAVGAHPACRSGAYVIWNRRIYSFDRRFDGWRSYTGSNPHTHHCHLSVATDAAGFDSRAPWFVMAEEDDMFSDEDRERLRRIEKEVLAERDRDKVTRERDRKRFELVKARLDEVLAGQADDATKMQVRAIRDLIVATEAEPVE